GDCFSFYWSRTGIGSSPQKMAQPGAGLHSEHYWEYRGHRAVCGLLLAGAFIVLVVLTDRRGAGLFLFHLTSPPFTSQAFELESGDCFAAGARRLVGRLCARTSRLPGPAGGSAILVTLLPDRLQEVRSVAFRKPDLSPADGFAKREVSRLCPSAPAE